MGKSSMIAGLITSGIILVVCGYLLYQMAYRPGGGPYIYFYPVRYYGGIISMIVGVIFIIFGFISIFIPSPKTPEKAF